MAKYGENLGISRNKVCSCGQHKGVGTTSPHNLAQIYAWFRDKRPKELTLAQNQYLDSYEKIHGRIKEYIFGKQRS